MSMWHSLPFKILPEHAPHLVMGALRVWPDTVTSYEVHKFSIDMKRFLDTHDPECSDCVFALCMCYIYKWTRKVTILEQFCYSKDISKLKELLCVFLSIAHKYLNDEPRTLEIYAHIKADTNGLFQKEVSYLSRIGFEAHVNESEWWAVLHWLSELATGQFCNTIHHF